MLKIKSNPVILLVDNGSVRVSAQLALRDLANTLGLRINQTVHPVSILHSDKIDPIDIEFQLHQQPGRIFLEFMQEQLELGQRSFIIIPLFFGQSGALTSFLPSQLEKLQSSYGEFFLDIKDTLYPLPTGEPMLVNIFQYYLQQVIEESKNLQDQAFVLVDHGSPKPEITAVRADIANHLNVLFQDLFTIDEAVMERRDGKEYDFNGRLLKDYLEQRINTGVKKINILLLFLLPGRHAGENGDIQEIIEEAQIKHPQIRITCSPLIHTQALLLDCLEQRFNQP